MQEELSLMADDITVISRLRQEVSDLRNLVRATHAKAGSGVFVIRVPNTTPRQVMEATHRSWELAWESQGNIPPLLLVPEEMEVQGLDPAGTGIFILRVPVASMTQERLHVISRAWDDVWRRSDTGGAPLFIIPRDTPLELLSEAYLQAHGLMRIPSETNFAG